MGYARSNTSNSPSVSFFSSLLSCSLSRSWAQFCVPQWRRADDGVRTAGDRTRRRRLNKLSCAGWLPHDRGFVSGLPHSSDERRSADRLITGQEGSPPRPCLRQCTRLDCLVRLAPRRFRGSGARWLATLVLSISSIESNVIVVGPVELWATRQRRPSAAANPQGFAAAVVSTAARRTLAERPGLRPLAGRGGRSPR